MQAIMLVVLYLVKQSPRRIAQLITASAQLRRLCAGVWHGRGHVIPVAREETTEAIPIKRIAPQLPRQIDPVDSIDR